MPNNGSSDCSLLRIDVQTVVPDVDAVDEEGGRGGDGRRRGTGCRERRRGAENPTCGHWWTMSTLPRAAGCVLLTLLDGGGRVRGLFSHGGVAWPYNVVVSFSGPFIIEASVW